MFLRKLPLTFFEDFVLISLNAGPGGSVVSGVAGSSLGLSEPDEPGLFGVETVEAAVGFDGLKTNSAAP